MSEEIYDNGEINGREIIIPTKYDVKCPICGEKLTVGVELGYIKRVDKFPYPHICLHGNPVHAVIVYIDKHYAVRGVEGCDSIGIKKDGGTFREILRKWCISF